MQNNLTPARLASDCRACVHHTGSMVVQMLHQCPDHAMLGRSLSQPFATLRVIVDQLGHPTSSRSHKILMSCKPTAPDRWGERCPHILLGSSHAMSTAITRSNCCGGTRSWLCDCYDRGVMQGPHQHLLTKRTHSHMLRSVYARVCTLVWRTI